MLTPDRQAMILKIVKENRVASIHDLVKSTKCSESTIRRDLDQLEKAHQLLRFHGGAQAIPQKSDERTINERALSFLNEKRAIARRGAEYVEAGDCLFLDAGTTTYQMIDFLPPGTIVVTNGLTLIARCIEKKLQTYVIGGMVKPVTNAAIGKGALDDLQSYRFDKCFMGMNGVDCDAGLTTPDPEEAIIKREAMRLSNERYVLADRSKFGRVTFSHVNPLSAATIITNEDENNDELDPYKKMTRIEVIGL